jgi:aminoglycoside phosphotransferase (APT) family kinase protein
MQADAELREICERGFPGSRLLACSELGGGVSARAVAVDLLLADERTQRVVVRRPGYATPEEALRVVEREHTVLSRCAALGIPAPKPCFLDRASRALIVEYLEGAPELAPPSLGPMLEQMAGELALIHRAPIDGGLSTLPRRNDSAGRDVLRAPRELDTSLDEPRLRSILAELWPWPQHNSDSLLHGDYWPGNLLWKDGKLVAVLDWEEAELGDPLADVAVSRLDVAWAFGERAMSDFTDLYREKTAIDWQNLARWDLCVALRPMGNLTRWASVYPKPPIGRPDITEQSLRERHRRFVKQALQSLGMDRQQSG